MYCLHIGGADGVEDGQHLLLFVMLGDEFVAVGAILDHTRRGSTGSLAVGGVKDFRDVSNGFGGWPWKRLSRAGDDGGV